MSRKLLTAALGLLALTVIVGAPFMSASSAASGTNLPAITNAAHEVSTHVVKMGPQSDLAMLKQATQIGPHSESSNIKLTIGLKLHNVAKLKSFLRQVQYPGSPSYHQWLTPAKFTALYGPTTADVAAVTRFLQAHHIKVLDVSSNRILIHTEATTGAYEHALGIMINDYKLNGRSFYSTTDSPQLPRTIAPMVNGILGLNLGVQMRPHHRKAADLRPGVKTTWPQSAPPPATTGAYLNQLQFAKAYNWPSLTDTSNGAGTTIAILSYESSGLVTSDFDAYWSGLGLPTAHAFSIVNVDGSPSTGGEGETTLDIEYSGAMAPGANIILYEGATPSFPTTANTINQMVTDNTADVASTSWGLCDSEIPNLPTINPLLMQAASQGISFSAAAGDNGASDGCSGSSNADFPSSNPYVLSANGTVLTISDTSGTYESETAWSGTGGGDSAVYAQPSWQTGPEVPNSGDRMNGDMAMHGGGRALLYYQDGAWNTGYVGTSFVSPEFAGLFAQVDAENGGRVGQSNELVYNDVNAGNQASDFRDVTTGTNGHPAGPNWDYPTGWGSPKVTSLISHLGIQGPKGMLSGTVTAAASGSAIAGATVTAVDTSTGTSYSTQTAADGTYTRLLPVGSFNVTVTDFGYTSGTATVSITNGNTTTKDFQLAVAPTAALHGIVRDGSGHGWRLYAEVKVSAGSAGQVADVWTNPATGHYSVNLPEGETYTVTAAAYQSGYNPLAKTVTLNTDTDKDFALTVSASCSAPGYTFSGGFGQDFNGSTFPPAGWTVNHTPSNSVTWELSSAEPTDNGNYTGGTGTAADADSNDFGSGAGTYDTSLITPPIAVTSVGPAAVLKYKASYVEYSTEALDLDISTNGGTTWTNISHWTTTHGVLYTSGVNVQVGLGPYLPASGTFQLRWHYYNPNGDFDWYAQIDDVSIGGCAPVPGGLVEGYVKDSNTGYPLIGAKVTDDQGASATTFANPADPNLANGLYILFATPGNRTLTATDGNYSAGTASVTVANNDLKPNVNFALKGAQFKANPSSFTENIMVGSSATASFALSNTGNGTGLFKILAIDAPPPVTAPTGAFGRGAPLHNVHGHFSPRSLIAQGQEGRRPSRPYNNTIPIPAAASSGWTAVADYPVPVVDGCAATDTATGKVYSFTGVSNGANTTNDYVYDPGSDSWSPIADFPAGGLESPACAVVNGNVYLTNGDTGAGAVNSTLYIYNIAGDSFTTGPDIPNGGGDEFGSKGVALNNEFYVIGGCGGAACSAPTANVYVYNPSSQSWSQAANYPTGVFFEGCGSIGGAIYCGGGFNSATADTTAAYKYDPASDAWTPIANLLYDNWGMASIGTSNGHLLFQDGVTDGTATLTNMGQIYDATSDSWSMLPNNPVTTYRSGGACGFYQVGGMDSAGSFTGITSVELLPGYNECGSSKIPWLTVAPTQGTLAPGAKTTVMLTFDGTGQKEDTTSKGYLQINGAPGTAPIVPLTVHWLAQPVDLDVSGSVSPTGTVAAGASLAYNITVQNLPDAGGSASQVKLAYQIPAGVDYVASSGATCAPPSGSAPPPTSAGAAVVRSPIASSVVGPATVTCDFGSLNPNQGKLVTIAVRATAAASSISGTFVASAREPDSDASNNTLTLATNPAVGPTGPTGPTGPRGPKGSSGSSGFGFLGLGMLALLGMGAVAVETRKRRRQRD
ncbi:MAG: protease pro-enzyme activation domain-containing protein [Gammaproteobacteria bacterium]